MKFKEGKKYEKTTVALSTDLVEKIMKITQRKFPLKKVHYYVEAIREALYDYIEMNQESFEDK